MRRWAWVPAVFLLVGCSPGVEGEEEAEVITTVAKQEPFPTLDNDVAAIEKDTSTEVGIALYDGKSMHAAGSLHELPAWSSIKVPIAMAAAEHCEYDAELIEQFTEAAIEWSDNDGARALWDCMGSDAEASKLVGEEIAKSGSDVEVEGAFGTTTWPFTGQARYGYYLSKQDEDDPVIAMMHHIDKEQSYGLGQLEGVPFKGGWSDYEVDGSWHTRQFGWVEVDGVVYGVAIGARSEAGSYEDTVKALDEAAELLR